MKISKGTIVRTIGIILVLVNMVLQRMGHDIINVSESEILALTETLIEIAVIVVAWWKNNSFSEKAIKADEFLQTLRASSDTTNVSQEIEDERGEL